MSVNRCALLCILCCPRCCVRLISKLHSSVHCMGFVFVNSDCTYIISKIEPWIYYFFIEQNIDFSEFKCTDVSKTLLDPYDFKSKSRNCYFTFFLCYKLHGRLPYSACRLNVHLSNAHLLIRYIYITWSN